MNSFAKGEYHCQRAELCNTITMAVTVEGLCKEQLATLASKRINDRLTVNSPLSFHQYRELQEKKYKRP